jgi:hypothetical protein
MWQNNCNSQPDCTASHAKRLVFAVAIRTSCVFYRWLNLWGNICLSVRCFIEQKVFGSCEHEKLRTAGSSFVITFLNGLPLPETSTRETVFAEKWNILGAT